MKTAFINLPAHRKLIRRYTCSYYASNFLFPPLELMYLAGIVQKWKNDDAIIIDAIAEHLDFKTVVERLKVFKPDLLVFMTGIETLSSDMLHAATIKYALGRAKVICFGYLPTQFPGEMLKYFPFIDFIIINEPELVFSELYNKIKNNESIISLPGLVMRVDTSLYIGPPNERIKDLDSLPFPARNLIHNSLYNELFSPQPFTTIQSSRGCSAMCTYCIRTFGREVVSRSIESLLNEIKEIVSKYHVKTIRFIDDNFCFNRNRLVTLCQSIISEKFSFRWSCLARVDALNEEMVFLMRKAGCFRIYLGIETFSQRLLAAYKKNYNPQRVKALLKQMKKNNIESIGFFLIGGVQTRREFEDDAQTAIASGLDYIVVEKISSYPGTPLFEQMKKEVHFTLHPYENRLKDRKKDFELCLWEKEFYQKFYFRWAYCFKMLARLLAYPQDLLVNFMDLVIFMLKRPGLRK